MAKRRILKELRRGGYLYVLHKGSLCGIGRWKISIYFYEDLHPPVVAMFTVVGKKFYYTISPFESPIYGCYCVTRPRISKNVNTLEKRMGEYFNE